MSSVTSGILYIFNSDAFIIILRVLFIYICFKKIIKFISGKNELAENTKKPKRIEIITDSRACQKACTELKDHCKELSAIGFDCEWNNEFNLAFGPKKGPVALLQLASCKGLCCLFRLNILKNIPTELSQILENPDIVKLGVSPLQDAKLLEKDYSVQVQTVLDLRFLYPNIPGGLSNLSENVLGIPLNKDPSLIFSDWEAPEFTKSQELYAAMDGFVGIEIFKKWLKEEKINSFEYTNLLYNIRLCGFYDRYFPQRNSLGQSRFKKQQNSPCEYNPESLQSHQNYKNYLRGLQLRKKPLYDNCFMHAPDGELLCSCDKKKAEWYIERGLAEVFLNEPFSIKLSFKPAARANDKNEGRFYQQLKKNCCVVCGDKNYFSRFNVVPQEYRKHFPKIMKSHQSHDIVLLCVNCHQAASYHTRLLKKKLAKTCNAPFNNGKIKVLDYHKRIKSYGKALLKSGEKIPMYKKTSMEKELKSFFNVENLTINELQNAASLEVKDKNEYPTHGLKVTEYFTKQSGGLMELEKLWRKNFLTTMKPLHLPALWSITHNHSRLISQESS